MRQVFMFVPAFGQTIQAATFLTTHAVRDALVSKGIGSSVSTLSFPDIAELRSMVTTIWYDSMPTVDHLLFIDADMGFPPDLVLDMFLFNEPVVGTIYPQRKVPLSWAGSGNGSKTTERRGNFMQVEGVGMGCTLIHRDVIRIMLEKMPEIVDNRIDLHPAVGLLREAKCNRLIRAFEKLDLPERGIVSEDLSFCIRWNQCGGKVWAAIGHKMSHVGPYDYSASYLETITQQEALAAQQQSLQMLQAQPIMPAPAVIEAPTKAKRTGKAATQPHKQNSQGSAQITAD